MKRTGIPLQQFADRWGRLSACPSTMEQSSTNIDPRAWNAISGETFPLNIGPALPHVGQLGGLFGGTVRTQGRFVKMLAAQLLETCPGSWTKGYGTHLRSKLTKYVKVPISESRNPAEILGICEYRFSMMRHADSLLLEIGVPYPGGKRCHEWEWQEWFAAEPGSLQTDANALLNKVVSLLHENKIFPEPMKEQGPHFHQPYTFVAAGLVDGYSDWASQVAKIVVSEFYPN